MQATLALHAAESSVLFAHALSQFRRAMPITDRDKAFAFQWMSWQPVFLDELFHILVRLIDNRVEFEYPMDFFEYAFALKRVGLCPAQARYP